MYYFLKPLVVGTTYNTIEIIISLLDKYSYFVNSMPYILVPSVLLIIICIIQKKIRFMLGFNILRFRPGSVRNVLLIKPSPARSEKFYEKKVLSSPHYFVFKVRFGPVSERAWLFEDRVGLVRPLQVFSKYIV